MRWSGLKHSRRCRFRIRERVSCGAAEMSLRPPRRRPPPKRGWPRPRSALRCVPHTWRLVMPDLDRRFPKASLVASDYAWLDHIIASLHGGAPSKWAILCVCFKDDPTTLPTLDHPRKPFTTEGPGTINMVES